MKAGVQTIREPITAQSDIESAVQMNQFGKAFSSLGGDFPTDMVTPFPLGMSCFDKDMVNILVASPVMLHH